MFYVFVNTDILHKHQPFSTPKVCMKSSISWISYTPGAQIRAETFVFLNTVLRPAVRKREKKLALS